MSKRKRHAPVLEIVVEESDEEELEVLPTSTQTIDCVVCLRMACAKTKRVRKVAWPTQKLEEHIALDHLNWKPWKCEHCTSNSKSDFPTEGLLRQHYHDKHPGLTVKVDRKRIAKDPLYGALGRMLHESLNRCQLKDEKLLTDNWPKQRFMKHILLQRYRTPKGPEIKPAVTSASSAEQSTLPTKLVTTANSNVHAEMKPKELAAMTRPHSASVAMPSTSTSPCRPPLSSLSESSVPLILFDDELIDSKAFQRDDHRRKEIRKLITKLEADLKVNAQSPPPPPPALNRRVTCKLELRRQLHMRVLRAMLERKRFVRNRPVRHKVAIFKQQDTSDQTEQSQSSDGGSKVIYDFHDDTGKAADETQSSNESTVGEETSTRLLLTQLTKGAITKTMVCGGCTATIKRHHFSILTHMWQNHMSEPALKCHYCEVVLWLPHMLRQMRMHLKRSHADREQTYADDSKRLSDQLCGEIRKCFSTDLLSSNEPHVASPQRGHSRRITTGSAAVFLSKPCNICKRNVSSVLQTTHAKVHVRTDPLDTNPDHKRVRFFCKAASCKFAAHIRQQVESHIVKDHHKLLERKRCTVARLVQDKSKKLADKELDQMILHCFGPSTLRSHG